MPNAPHDPDASPSRGERFVQPAPEEIDLVILASDAPEGDLDREDLVQAEHLEGFKQRWDKLGELDVEALLELIKDGIAQHPQEQRDLLVTWIAAHTGLSPRKVKPRHLERGALLWDLLRMKRFSSLSAPAHDALLAIARSTAPSRPTLHPLAATAAIAIWRHDSPHTDAAIELLTTRALPDDLDWLWQLVKRHKALDRKEEVDARGMLELARLQLSASFWNVAALLVGMHFVKEYGRWSMTSPTLALTRACDVAATQYPHKEEAWIEVMCDVVVGGHVVYPWVERVMEAGIRLAIDDPRRERALRAHHEWRPYDADHARLVELYRARAQTWAMAREDREPADYLLEEAHRIEEHNPARAQRLMELTLLERVLRKRPGQPTRKLARALDNLGEDHLDIEQIARLLGYYIKNYEIDPARARFVRSWSEDRRVRARVDQDELELYLIIGDYERAFQHLTCKYDGVELHHADKHAATRVKYFIEKRVKPGSMTRVVDAAFSPVEWLGATMGDIRLIHHAVGRGLEAFEARIQREDLSQAVVGELQETGARIERFDQIGDLSIDHIEGLLHKRKSQRLLLGALAGGISGGIAPLGWGVLSMADIPVVLGLTADICGRFCWYYGFDPREERELPMEILAVALGGSRPAAIQPMLLRQNLREFAVQKSLVVGALAKGAINQAAGRAINQLFEAQLSPRLAQSAQDLARRAVQRNFEKRATTAAPGKALPILGALLGAALNAALVYDLCEAAQAVLTDRFLERKYPDWPRHFDMSERLLQANDEEE